MEEQKDWQIEINYKGVNYKFPIKNYKAHCCTMGGHWVTDMVNDELRDCMDIIEEKLKVKELDMNHFDYMVWNEHGVDADNLINEYI